MKNEKLKIVYLIMLCVCLIVFCFSLFILIETKKEELYKLEHNKLIELSKTKSVTK